MANCKALLNSLAFCSSCQSSALSLLSTRVLFLLAGHFAHLDVVHAAVTGSCEDQYKLSLSSLLSCMPSLTGCAIQHSVDFHTSGWLSVLPLVHHHFDLSAQQFCDALCLCYHHLLSLMPASYDGCGGDLSLTHALDCYNGDLITQRHNEIRDSLGDRAAMGYWDVFHEPVVCDGIGDSPALIADLGIRGVWIPQAKALFDVRVTDLMLLPMLVGLCLQFYPVLSYAMPLLLLLLYL